MSTVLFLRLLSLFGPASGDDGNRRLETAVAPGWRVCMGTWDASVDILSCPGSFKLEVAEIHA